MHSLTRKCRELFDLLALELDILCWGVRVVGGGGAVLEHQVQVVRVSVSGGGLSRVEAEGVKVEDEVGDGRLGGGRGRGVPGGKGCGAGRSIALHPGPHPAALLGRNRVVLWPQVFAVVGGVEIMPSPAVITGAANLQLCEY